MKKVFSYSAIPFFLGMFFYLGFKLSTLSIRLSDSNIYFVTASHLAEGAVLYRDIFFTNFPLLPYFSVVYFWLIGGNLQLYFFTSAVEASVVALLIFYLLLKEGRSYMLATTSSFVYLFSMLVLVTTDHQTGVFLASLFAVASYIFFKRKRYVWVGVFCALMLLVKAYFLPVVLTFGLYMLVRKDYRNLLYFVFGGIGAGLLVLMPFLLLAREELISQVFGYSLSRGGGIPKFEVAKFYVFRDALIFGVLLYNLFKIKQHLFWGIFSVFSLAFFLVYQDIYYLYLNFTAPFAAISFPNFFESVRKKLKMQSLAIATILGVFFLWNVYASYSEFSGLGRVEQIDTIVQLVEQEGAEYVYGNNDIAPVVSYLSGVPQLNGIIDTNENIFRSGVLDAEEMTDDVLSSKTILVLHSAYYPRLGVEEDVFAEIVEEERIKNSCVLLRRFPVVAEGYTNNLAVFRCW